MVHTDQLFPPVGGKAGVGNVSGDRLPRSRSTWGGERTDDAVEIVGGRDKTKKCVSGRRKRGGNGVVQKWSSGQARLRGTVRKNGGIEGRVGNICRTNVIKDAVPLVGGRNGLTDGAAPRHFFAAPLLGPEEEGFLFVIVVKVRDVDGAADGVTPIVFLVRGTRDTVAVVEPAVGVEEIVAPILEGAAMELLGTGFCFHLNGAGTVLSVLRAVI